MSPLRLLALPAALLCASALAQPLPTLKVDASPLGRTARVERVASVPQSEGTVMTFPAHVQAVLNLPGQRWKPQYAGQEPPAYVSVIPLNTLKAHYPTRPDLVREVSRVVTAAQGGRITGEMANLPHVPQYNAAQMATGSLARVSNEEIQGFRYLAVYAQDLFRFSQDDVLYIFQGVTRDGKQLVTVRVPYVVPSLPTAEQRARDEKKNGPFLPYDQGQAAFEKASRTYLAALTTKLDAESRTGRLAPFDAVVRSIQVR